MISKKKTTNSSSNNNNINNNKQLFCPASERLSFRSQRSILEKSVGMTHPQEQFSCPIWLLWIFIFIFFANRQTLSSFLCVSVFREKEWTLCNWTEMRPQEIFEISTFLWFCSGGSRIFGQGKEIRSFEGCYYRPQRPPAFGRPWRFHAKRGWPRPEAQAALPRIQCGRGGCSGLRPSWPPSRIFLMIPLTTLYQILRKKQLLHFVVQNK